MKRRVSGTITTRQALVECIGLKAADITEAHERRMERVLTANGLVQVTREIAGRYVQVWVDPNFDVFARGDERATRQ